MKVLFCFRFIINLLVVNMFSCLLFLPLVTMDLVMSPDSVPGQCLINEAVSHIIANLSLHFTLLIAGHPFPLAVSGCSPSSLNDNLLWKSCKETSPYQNSHHWSSMNYLLSSGITIAGFVVPTFLMIFIYSKIYLEAHHSS